jgi:transposase InsO family protein
VGSDARSNQQFTGAAFTGVLIKNAIAISMDGKGAWRDNVFVERLWRSVKYEEVYLRKDLISRSRYHMSVRSAGNLVRIQSWAKRRGGDLCRRTLRLESRRCRTGG